jgi:2-dehydro-3-deoxyphosphogluconate aldolase/(4S)-4-hydroxy-2-oxoglutarate aldolase
MLASLRQFRIIPAVKVKNLEVDDALKLAGALAKSGLPVMEIMFRRFSDSKAMRAVASQIPNFTVGAGGILNKDQLLRSIESGAKFAISPGVNADTIREAARRNIVYIPGASTPSDIESILINGSVDFHFFPAEEAGGVRMLKAITDPYDHLPLDIICGGASITPEKAAEYLKIPQVAAVIAHWIAPAGLVESKNWEQIGRNAEEAVKIARSCH